MRRPFRSTATVGFNCATGAAVAISSVLGSPSSSRFSCRRCCARQIVSTSRVRCNSSTELPPVTDSCWVPLGDAIIARALTYDTGPEAFAEVLEARRQLEIVVQSPGYDLTVHPFGGVAVMSLLEVGGDVDFSAVAEVEPQFEEASEIVSRLGREMRRLGLKCTALPRARVPVIKVDRASHALPGSPLHANTSTGIFQFTRGLTLEEQYAFMDLTSEHYAAVRCEWDNNDALAIVQFPDTSSLMVGLTHIRKLGSVEIPVRLPADPRQGPELYRFPFDLCLSTTGLSNSYLFGEYLRLYPYARHLILMLKRWGRSSGVVNSMDGMLSSYAITVMLVHFLVKVGTLPVVETSRVTAQPHLLPETVYRPLSSKTNTVDSARLGYLFASFFEYYSSVFNYETDVVCTTNPNLTKEEVGWHLTEEHRPPHYFFAIKDPFGAENIARNLSREAQIYVQQSCRLVVDYLKRDLKDPSFMLNSVVEHGPRPQYSPVNGTFNPKYVDPANAPTTEAFRKLKKMEFHRRRESLQRFGQNTMRQHNQVRVAQDVTRNMLSWLRSDETTAPGAGDDAFSSGGRSSSQGLPEETPSSLGK